MKCQRKCNTAWICLCFCANSLQDMNTAVITPCSHFFHAGCLKKWLYVQETCPLCHSQLKSQSPAASVPNQDTPAANQNPAGQGEATAKKRQEDGASPDDRMEEATGEQEQEAPGMSTGETSSSSSGAPSAPQHLVETPSPSSSSSPLMTDSLQSQLATDHPSSSSSDTLDRPPCLPALSHTSIPCVSHHSSSLLQAQPEMIPPAEAEAAPPSTLGNQESSSGPSSQLDQPTSEEQSHPPCSLWTPL